MAQTHDTIDGLLAEMRFHGQQNIDAEKDKPEYGILTVEGRIAQNYADRLEAAHKRERGDCAKLREALKLCLRGMCGYCRMDAEARGMTTECVNGCEVMLDAKAALAATEQEGGTDGR